MSTMEEHLSTRTQEITNTALDVTKAKLALQKRIQAATSDAPEFKPIIVRPLLSIVLPGVLLRFFNVGE